MAQPRAEIPDARLLRVGEQAGPLWRQEGSSLLLALAPSRALAAGGSDAGG